MLLCILLSSFSFFFFAFRCFLIFNTLDKSVFILYFNVTDFVYIEIFLKQKKVMLKILKDITMERIYRRKKKFVFFYENTLNSFSKDFKDNALSI